MRLRAPETRLISLTGPGGTGKTRLAREVANDLRGAFADAVWFAPLADLPAANLIPDAILDALRAPRTPQIEPLEQVVRILSEQPGLLVLDNFEHLVAEGALIVRTLLERAPLLTCLVTSRHLLNLAGERVFPVSPLPTPEGEAPPEQIASLPSVQLFVDRAQTVRPDFQVTAQNASAVAALCRRLEGIPLALELAAARAQVLTPAQMLSQLENRFAFLVSRRRDGNERHRTLRAAIDWSYRLLSTESRALFARLFVFRGGWTAEAAAEICDEPLALDYLAELRACSLILAEEREDEMRFRMLETLREYAAEQLSPAERAAQERRHARYYLALAERAEPELRGPRQVLWLERLDGEHDNFRAALAWCLNAPESAEAGLRLAGALWRFWDVRGHISEGRDWLKRMVDADRGGTSLYRAKALNALGHLAKTQDDYAAARGHFTESLAIRRRRDDAHGIAASLNNLGLIALAQGDYGAARTLLQESRDRERAAGNERGVADALNNLGIVAQYEGRFAEARGLFTESLTIERVLNNQWGAAETLSNLGEVACLEGDHAAARALLEEALALKRELGDLQGIAVSQYNLGLVAIGEGRTADARAALAECLPVHHRLGDLWGVSFTLEAMACLRAATGEARGAARLFATAERLRESIGAPLPPAYRQDYAPRVAAARAALGEEAFGETWAAGRALTAEQAIRDALETDIF